MKLAILADIHANFTALETVAAHIEAWGADQVVLAGDVVNRGPRSVDCLRFVQEKQQRDGWVVLKGNHEDYVIKQASPDSPRESAAFEIFRHTHWTYLRLGVDVAALEVFPDVHQIEGPDGREVRITHASMLGNKNGVFPSTKDDELREKIGESPPALFCTAHTHYPLIRQLDETQVVNVGSVGLPFDGDRRASYAQLTWHNDDWKVEVVRLEYDRQHSIDDFKTTGFLWEAGPMTLLILAELLYARPQLFLWIRDYEEAVLAKEISVEEAVHAQIVHHGYEELWRTI